MSLPLKVKVAIRDLWNNHEAPLQRAISTLEGLLGLPFRCEPEWPLLLNELDSVYRDTSEFVAAVSSTVQVWCCAMAELMRESEGECEREKWAEALLESIGQQRAHGLRLSIEVSRDDSPRTRHDAAHGGFVLSLPNTQILQAATFLPLLKGQLFAAFDEPELKPDDWADVAAEAAPTPAGQRPLTALPSRAGPEVLYLADPKTLSRPDELLLRPPYHLFVHGGRGTAIEIQCSHSPSLEFLAAYLKKWCRTNNSQSHRPPIATIALHQSPFGLGLVHDTLTITTEAYRSSALSPTIVLSLVEGVLGYERVFSDGSTWQFRKDGPLKQL